MTVLAGHSFDLEVRDRFDALLRKILWKSQLVATLLDPDKRCLDDFEREKFEEEGMLELAEQIHEDALAIKDLFRRADDEDEGHDEADSNT